VFRWRVQANVALLATSLALRFTDNGRPGPMVEVVAAQ
jgi:hypothetical protein